MSLASRIEKKFLVSYDKYADSIFRHCFYRLNGDRELAKEMTQEVFTKTWHYTATEGKNVHYIKAFLYRTANNMIIDHVRSKKEQQSLEDLQESGFEPVDYGGIRIFDTVDAGLLKDIMNKLSDQDREIIIMRYAEGLKPREIANILELSTNVVSVRINRAKKRLKKLVNV